MARSLQNVVFKYTVMKPINLIFIALAALPLLTGCLREDSENVNQDRIWAHYEMFYNENEDVTYIRSTFRFGHALGTRLELTEPSGVRFNGSNITWRPLLGYYERSFPGFIDSGTFQFEDMNGNYFNNECEIRTIDQPENLATLSLSQASAYAWVGNPVASREAVTLILTGGNNGGSETFTTAAIGATELVLATNKLGNLAPGQGNAVLERAYTPMIQQGTSVGGLITGRFRASDKTLTLE